MFDIFSEYRVQKSHLDNMNRNRNLQKQVSIEQARQIARQSSDGYSGDHGHSDRYSGEWSRGGSRNVR